MSFDVGKAARTNQGLNPALGAAAGNDVVSVSNGGLGQKDQPVDPTKFGDIWKQIQSKYGAKAEKPREIKKTLGKDDFLKIMITQMKHQDPTNPFKAEQFAAEMAQFTTVEQLQNLNQGMNKLTSNNQPLEKLAMANMIGKTVTVDRERFPHTEGSNEVLGFRLPENASQVRISIMSETGEKILEKDLGEFKAGENSFSWDGLKSNTLPAKSGGYSYHIEAQNANGQALQISQRTQARIIGVGFEGSEPMFLVGDPKQPEKVTMRNIVRIDDMGVVAPAPLIPGAQSLAATAAAQAQTMGTGDNAPAAPAASGANFFTFQKGVGSKPLDLDTASPEVRAAINQYQMQAQEASQGASPGASQGPQPGAQAQQGRQARNGPDEEKGFPNGLRDPDSAGSELGADSRNKTGDTMERR